MLINHKKPRIIKQDTTTSGALYEVRGKTPPHLPTTMIDQLDPTISLAPVSTTPRVTNRLLLLPNTVDGSPNLAKKDELVALMRQVGGSSDSYIYVALSGLREVEDDETGVRLLPLTPEYLPRFDSLESVWVLNDKDMAAVAASEYPAAAVYNLEPTLGS